MRLTLLGTGNAAGMPLYGCDCEHCLLARTDVRLQRSPCSALLQVGNRQFLLDAGQVDLHKRFPAGTLDGIFLTNFHPDHVQGLFHLRWGIGKKISVYTPPDSVGCADLYKHAGILEFLPQSKFAEFELGALKVTPVPLIHSKPTFGYLLAHANTSIAYLTDTKGLPPKTLALLAEQKLDLLVIDCSCVPGSKQRGHNNIDDALAINHALQPKRTILTHIGHELDIWLKANHQTLPANILEGKDGMVVFPPEQW